MEVRGAYEDQRRPSGSQRKGQRGPMVVRGGTLEARGVLWRSERPLKARGGPMEVRGAPEVQKRGPLEARGEVRGALWRSKAPSQMEAP